MASLLVLFFCFSTNPPGVVDREPEQVTVLGIHADYQRRYRVRNLAQVDINNATSIWTDARHHLADKLSKDIFDRWISVIDAKELQDDTIVLTVANDFYQTWLIENYLPLISQAVNAAASRELSIVFVVDKNLAIPDSNDESKGSIPKIQVSKKTTRPLKKAVPPRLNEKYTFDRFVVGPSNRFSHAAALAVAQSPARAYNPLFMYGGVGLGKTHLMQAIGHHALMHDHATISFLSCEQFTNDYIDALQRKNLVQFRNKHRNTDLLLIDDIHFLGGKERLQEEFFHTFNALFENHKQIVMTSDRPASEIPGLEQRLVSRFEWGLVTELETPDIETRIAILRKKQEQLNTNLPDQVLQYLAEHIRANIRRLEGALIRVGSYATLTGRQLDADTLEYLLRDTLDQEQSEILTMETIQRAVAEHYDIRFGDMTSKRRPQSIAFPRQVAMYLCRTMTHHSLPEIGTGFERNHATVLHAYRLVSSRIQQDSSLKQSVQQIKQRLSKRR